MTDQWYVLEWTKNKKTGAVGLRRHGPWLFEVAMGKRAQLNASDVGIVAVVRQSERGQF